MQYPPLPLVTAAPAAFVPWSWDATFAGRLCELGQSPSGGQRTLATTLVVQSQRAREPVAWLQPEGGAFYPPDAAAHGVDLEALVLVQLGGPKTPGDRVRAAELLLQTGSFGLVVVDLTDGALPSSWGWQGRLMALARSHRAAVVLLTATDVAGPSLGAWVSLRLVAQPLAKQTTDLRTFFDLQAEVLKHKGVALAGSWQLQRRGPDGLL